MESQRTRCCFVNEQPSGCFQVSVSENCSLVVWTERGDRESLENIEKYVANREQRDYLFSYNVRVDVGHIDSHIFGIEEQVQSDRGDYEQSFVAISSELIYCSIINIVYYH